MKDHDRAPTGELPPEQKAALEMAGEESLREALRKERGFAAGLFMGSWNAGRVMPFPLQSPSDRSAGQRFLSDLEAFLKRAVNADEIDRSGEVPDAVLNGLAEMGAFGIRMPTEYGGLGLSQTNLCRTVMLTAGHCGNVTALLAAHQGIGLPEPLLRFGTKEQKERFLPRLARGELCAFSLTERGTGSDPARLSTEAIPTTEGDAFVLNGEKLWCSNGPKAGVILVMARTPARMIQGRRRERFTAFMVETKTPGVAVLERCRFMGLRGLYNSTVRFTNVRVPRENVLLAEGKGMRVALTAVDRGRLMLAAASVGTVRRCLAISRRWAVNRTQWGDLIGHHAAVAGKIAAMSADLFAMESMVLYAAALVDRADRDEAEDRDFRLEIAMTKLWASEQAWRIVDDTLQLRGGRGYETAESQKRRGEEAVAVERIFRDARANTIVEGSSEIMRVLIAREALKPHQTMGAAVRQRGVPVSRRTQAAMRAGWFYAHWYPALLVSKADEGEWHPRLAGAMKRAERSTRKLARALFHAMTRYGAKLERQQLLMGRLVNIGTELFAMAAACSRAQALSAEQGEQGEAAIELAACFCQRAEARIDGWFRELYSPADASGYDLAQRVLRGELKWLEEG